MCQLRARSSRGETANELVAVDPAESPRNLGEQLAAEARLTLHANHPSRANPSAGRAHDIRQALEPASIAW